MSNKKVWMIIAAVSMCFVLAGCGISGWFNGFTNGSKPNSTVVFADPITFESDDSISDIVEKLLPACVTIFVDKGDKKYLGSGIAVAPNGIIATNYHVIEPGLEDGYQVRIALDGDAFDGYRNNYYNFKSATILWYSAETDTALIKASVDIPYATMEDRTVFLNEDNRLRIMEPVYAIGTPLDFSLQNTCTTGVVSQLNRVAMSENNIYEDLIQNSCDISPGNSGGPLIDKKGKVIGLNTLARTDNDASGLFYAVPITPIISVLPNVISALENGKTYTMPKIGITVKDKNTSNSVKQNILVIDSVEVSSLLYGKAQKDDVITHINVGTVTYPITNRNSFIYALLKTKKGDTITVKLTSGYLGIEKVYDIVLK